MRVAQPRAVDVDGQKLEFGGTFDPRGSSLTITIDGEPALRGSFPPYTPTLRLSGDYRGFAVVANCYFSSNLSSKGGAIGAVSSAVQGGLGKSSDKCDLTVNGKVRDALYF